jgi:hypothetical protein
MHIKSCREIDSAVDEALKKHRNQVAKNSEEKKAAAVVAAQRELEAQLFPDNQMDVDMDFAVKYLFLFHFYFRVNLIFLQDDLLPIPSPLRSPSPPPRPSGWPVIKPACCVGIEMIYHPKQSFFPFTMRNPMKIRHQNLPQSFPRCRPYFVVKPTALEYIGSTIMASHLSFPTKTLQFLRSRTQFLSLMILPIHTQNLLGGLPSAHPVSHSSKMQTTTIFPLF